MIAPPSLHLHGCLAPTPTSSCPTSCRCPHPRFVSSHHLDLGGDPNRILVLEIAWRRPVLPVPSLELAWWQPVLSAPRRSSCGGGRCSLRPHRSSRGGGLCSLHPRRSSRGGGRCSLCRRQSSRATWWRPLLPAPSSELPALANVLLLLSTNREETRTELVLAKPGLLETDSPCVPS